MGRICRKQVMGDGGEPEGKRALGTVRCTPR
jgi:hypothetical protein